MARKVTGSSRYRLLLVSLYGDHTTKRLRKYGGASLSFQCPLWLLPIKDDLILICFSGRTAVARLAADANFPGRPDPRGGHRKIYCSAGLLHMYVYTFSFP